MKKLLSCLLLLSLAHGVFCQTNEKSEKRSKGFNTIYLEIGGPALLYSLNYERGFKLIRNPNKLNVRIGLSVLPLSDDYPDDDIILIPIGISLDFGKKKSFFQVHFNRTFDFSKLQFESYSNTSFGVGYVRRPIRGLYFHSSIMLIIFDEGLAYWEGSIKSIPWLGIGIGYSF